MILTAMEHDFDTRCPARISAIFSGCVFGAIKWVLVVICHKIANAATIARFSLFSTSQLGLYPPTLLFVDFFLFGINNICKESFFQLVFRFGVFFFVKN